ncbi:hypothetical protein K2173_009190 [Erythroxylum novogranatense]|uniref:Carbonic anhydrase n=1 Tax=Erythroxylum novogranatense TaxID=1862640 RepID=A0AAV8TD73_9ROSI|nr:hypothetical protein K2173_009190 [Erythroxylum novogranatense]
MVQDYCSKIFCMYLKLRKILSAYLNLSTQITFDMGGEYLKLAQFLQTQGIEIQYSCPYTSVQNGPGSVFNTSSSHLNHYTDNELELQATGAITELEDAGGGGEQTNTDAPIIYKNLSICNNPLSWLIQLIEPIPNLPLSFFFFLSFQPGEAFVIHNVPNMVPLYESGPSEANAALEFAVNSLKVIIGHSKCGGIRALISMHDDIKASWVAVGMKARLRMKAASASLNFDRLGRHCEKESVNCSLLNLLTYPWIEEKWKNGKLSIHSSYYDLAECTFEKWTLDYKGSDLKKEGGKSCIEEPSILVLNSAHLLFCGIPVCAMCVCIKAENNVVRANS